MNINDGIGKKFNKLLVLDKCKNYKVLCLCECGSKKEISWYSVKTGSSKTCGCENSIVRIKHKKGDRFGRLIIIERLPKSRVIAKCDCGNHKEFQLCSLITGKTKSCGCLNIELTKKHGLCDHPLYSVWEGMIQRCYNKNALKYENYGGGGVKVCDEWRNDFKIFYDWCINNGWRDGLDIDKDIKGNGLLYSPDTCTIVTHKQNTRNKGNNHYITYNGIKACISEWAEILGINEGALRARIKRKWDIERAFKNENFKFNQLKKAS
jgi:hypothetical protein